MIKKKVSLVLVLTMLMTLLIPTVAFGADYSGHWAEKTIQEWLDNGKLKGYEDGSFKPDAQITRAEFMTMVNSAFGYTEITDINFSDVDADDWYYQEVQKAVKAGYLLGYEDSTARPDNKISRQEAALIIARIKGLSDNEAGVSSFTDANEVASWAKGGVGAASSEKLIIGYEDGTFRPLREISRAEALTIIDRAHVKDTKPEEPGGKDEDKDDDSKGGKGNSGRGNGGRDDSKTTTSAAITGLILSDSTTGTGILAPSDVTTESALFTTTGTSITVKAITDDESDITVKVTAPDSDEVTKIKDEDIKESKDEEGNYTYTFELNDLKVSEKGYAVSLTISRESTRREKFEDTTYKFIVVRNK